MSGAYGLYSHIESNKTRSTILLAALFVPIYLFALLVSAPLSVFVTPALGVPPGEPALWMIAILSVVLAGAITGTWVWIGYRSHQSMIDRATGAYDVDRKEEPELYNLLENLCLSRGIVMPRLQIVETDALNAYATGMNDAQYRIAVTRGLMETLEKDEMEAVLAHELTHIRNGDVRMMVVAVVIVGALTFATEMLAAWVAYERSRMGSGGGNGTPRRTRAPRRPPDPFKTRRPRDPFKTNSRNPFGRPSRRRDSSGSSSSGDGDNIFLALLMLGIVWMAKTVSLLFRLALSRSREFLADAGSVELTKNPDALIRALRKIEGNSEIPGVPSGIMDMCIDKPGGWFGDLFSTHPSIERRIKMLVEVAGGRDPWPHASGTARGAGLAGQPLLAFGLLIAILMGALFFWSRSATGPKFSGDSLVAEVSNRQDAETAPMEVLPADGTNGSGDAAEPRPGSPDAEAFANDQGRDPSTSSRVDLGMRLTSLDDAAAQSRGLPGAMGALVEEVTPDGPADRAGLRSGDVVLGINGEFVDGVADVQREISQMQAGDTVSLRLLRDGQEVRINVEAGDAGQP